MLPPSAPCTKCRLRQMNVFAGNTPEQVSFIQARKVGEVVLPPGATILEEGQKADRLFTLLSGWAFRHKTLADGRRQILNILLPGDLVGLQAKMFDQAHHGVEALSEVVLCGFTRDHIWDVFRTFPDMALDITWLAANEERITDEALLSVGRRTAAERMAWLVLHIWQRTENLDLVRDGALPLPITQAHIADMLGLSLVHTNRTLQALRRRGLFELSGGTLRAVDEDGLARLARSWEKRIPIRPLF